MARCNDESLYTGYCTNPAKREKAHNSGKGAKYTRSRLPIKMIHIEEFESDTAARKREYQVKQFSKKKKELLVKTNSQKT